MFALTTTAYILTAIRLEERDLVRLRGTAYEEYQRRVPMLAPSLKALSTSAGDLAAPGRNAADAASR